MQTAFTFQKIDKKRESVRDRIEFFFVGNLGKKFPSLDLHNRFGTGFRGRASEINADEQALITIRNDTDVLPDGTEVSCYWAERRDAKPPSTAIAYETGKVR